MCGVRTQSAELALLDAVLPSSRPDGHGDEQAPLGVAGG